MKSTQQMPFYGNADINGKKYPSKSSTLQFCIERTKLNDSSSNCYTMLYTYIA